jgi:hypothetical protein
MSGDMTNTHNSRTYFLSSIHCTHMYHYSIIYLLEWYLHLLVPKFNNPEQGKESMCTEHYVYLS